MVSDAELQDALRKVANAFRMRVFRACQQYPDCIGLFEQWKDAFEMMLKYAGDPRTHAYADACLQEIHTALKQRGLTHY